MPFARLAGDGMSEADARELHRRVDEGVTWHEAAERLGDRNLARARACARPRQPAQRARVVLPGLRVLPLRAGPARRRRSAEAPALPPDARRLPERRPARRAAARADRRARGAAGRCPAGSSLAPLRPPSCSSCAASADRARSTRWARATSPPAGSRRPGRRARTRRDAAARRPALRRARDRRGPRARRRRRDPPGVRRSHRPLGQQRRRLARRADRGRGPAGGGVLRHRRHRPPDGDPRPLSRASSANCSG